MNLAPNGKPSNLTPEQYELVRTPEFKAWFGDWENDPANSSKVVGSNGEPLVCYHGSNNSNVNIFDSEKSGSVQYSDWGKGIYFTPSKSTANYYSNEALKKIDSEYNRLYQVFEKTQDFVDLKAFQNRGRELSFNEKTIVYSVFLNIKNPLIEPTSGMNDPFLSEQAIAYNKDGIFIMNNINFWSYDEIIAFKSNQIKLADGTNTTFDGENPDIRFDDGGSLEEGNNNVLEYLFNNTEDITPIKINGRTVGGIDVTTYRGDTETLRVHKMLILPEFQGKGIGAKAINKLFRENPNVKQIIGNATAESKSFWLKIGAEFHSNEHTAFTITRNPDIIFDNGGTTMKAPKLLAPNGKRSNLTPEQYKLVRTPEFKAWFGDWENSPETSSKVVGSNGEPLPVYHGTQAEPFVVFDGGSFFTDDYMNADGYASGEMVYEVFLNIKKPLIINARGRKWDNLKNKYGNSTRDIVGQLDMDKYDGVIFNNINDNWFDDEMGDTQNVYFSINPEQIKLADGTNTTFDGGNPDIRFEKGGLIAPNGKPSNLTPEQYKIVREKSFISWFGDWQNDPANASKVVDENGEPKVVTHSTPNEDSEGNKYNYPPFNIFDGNRIFNTPNSSVIPIWFSYKGNYAVDKTILNMLFFLNIKKLFLFSNQNHLKQLQKYMIEKYENYDVDLEYDYNNNWEAIEDENLPAYISEIGFDGYKTDSENAIAIFKSEQGKLADRTNTTFDSNNPDIRFDEGGELEEDFIMQELDNDLKEFYKNRAIKNIDGIDYFFSRLNIYTEKNVFTIELPSGEEIGRATLNENENYLINIRIDENYRRKGLGLNLYNFIEYVTGKKLKPSPIKISQQAKGLWNKRNPEILFKNGGNVLLAPNGKPSNLTPEQYKLVRTPEFKAWFGDWENDPENASKVVDFNGEPLVVYHGTPYGGFYEFDLNNVGKNTIPYWGEGVYLTTSKSYAKGYAENKRTETQQIYNLFAKCLKPYIVKRHLIGRDSYMKMVEENQYNDFNDFLIDNNYDSVIILDGENIKDAIEIMTPLSNQIKLADGTNTTFDGNNPDIRFSLGGEIESYKEQGILELNFYPTNSEHAKEHCVDAKKPLYIQNLIVKESDRLKNIGQKVLLYLDEYAKKNGHDVIFGNISQKATMTKDNRTGYFTEFTDIDYIKHWLFRNGYNVNRQNNNFYKVVGKTNPDIRFDEGGNVPDEFWGNQAGGVLIICSRTNKVLLLKRSPYVLEPETWGMISGKLDAGESIEEAVAREVKEETGWKIDNLIPSYVFEKNDFTFYNFISLVDIEFTPTLDWENTDYGWFDLNNLPDNLHFGVDILLLKDKYLKGLRYASVEKGLSKLKQKGRNINDKEYQSLVKLRAELEQNRNKYFREGGFLTNSDEIKCYSCNWKWKVKDGGDDLFICHKCYTDNSKFYNLSSEESHEILDTTSYKKGGRTIAQTPAPKKDQIKGSDKNKDGSSKDIKSADKIEFNEKTLTTIKNKVAEHNEKHPNKKVNLPSAKAVVRRGMGAYSSSYRPTISGGKPNSRVAWGLARLNAFLYKIVKGKSKSGKYSQDNDLIEELGYKVQKFEIGGIFHGSPYYFDKFNTDKIGSGIGQQQDGWGIYLTDDKESSKNYGNYIYETTLFKGKNLDEYTFIDINKPVKKDLLEKIIEPFQKLGFNVSEILEFDYMGLLFYKTLSRKLGGDKKASLFLLNNGIDGIKRSFENSQRVIYRTDYVIFDENAITIENKEYLPNNYYADGGLVGNIYTETIYFAISDTENTYDIYAQGNDLDKIRSEYNSISPSDFNNPNSNYNSKILESRINKYEFIGDNTLNAEDYVYDLQNTDYWNLTEEDINHIEFDSVFAINKSTDEMIDEIQEFIKQEYNIGGRYAKKYMTISIKDENENFIADLNIRTADHSQNARNNDNTSYNLSFVIANKNATEGRFIPLGTQYYYDDSADIEDIKEEIKGIIDEKIEYIKENGKKYEDGGDIQAYEDAMGISEFKEGGETKPKKVYVSIRLPYDIEKLWKKGDSFENFNKYFYRYEDKPFQELKNGTLKGLVGVSSSPNNIAEWFVSRDCLIVMDYDRFMSMNETETINYYDPYQLMKNNLYLFRRLYANVSRYGEQDDAVIQTLRKILEKIVPEINLEINVSKGQKYTELYRISRFLNPYQTSAFPNWIEKNQIKIENPIDLTNAILDFNKLNDSYLGSGFENPVLTFDELLPIVEKGITNASSIYDSEQEIVLINRQLNIPKNSQLFFIQSERESNKNELIEKYNLREIYKVYFVETKEIEKYRNIWLKKEKEKFNNKLEQGREDLELKKEQVVQELLDYFLEKSISYVKNELEKESLEYYESLDYYDETDDDSIEQNLFSIPLVESIMNTYVLIVKNFWKAFIQKKQVENLDLYAFDMFYFNVKQELINYFENNKDELEKLNNYRNTRGSGSLDPYRFQWLMLKTINDYENLPELIDYKELAKMYLDKMGREIYRYYDKNNLKLVSQYKDGGQTDAQKNKISKVMGEFKRGELNTSYGTKVTDDKQAIAIALSTAGIQKKEEGGVIEGQLHTECNDDSGCGEKFDVGGVGNIIEAERDEAVIVSRAFSDTNRYKVKGTPSQIASALNVMGGGKNFDSGATIYFNGKTIDTNKIKKETNDTDVKDDIESGSVIINRRSMYDDTIYEVEGTPKQIASAINSVNGYGVVIENGATIKEA